MKYIKLFYVKHKHLGVELPIGPRLNANVNNIKDLSYEMKIVPVNNFK